VNKLKDRREKQHQAAQTLRARRASRDFVSTREAHDQTGVPVRTLQRWATEEGRIRYERRGKKKKLLYVSLSDVRKVAKELKPGKKGGK